ncbi:MAG: LytTR family DNA-binding domain-containing protein [Bacteroidales bacterium]|nr:LytTR family DNA-binding domain-containing protein [Bacteroidales bacterium]
MLKIAIVDDEQRTRKMIASIIQAEINDIEVIGEAENCSSAHQLIKSKKPDLVLLDINMPGGTAFNLLEKCDKIDFKIIFITAYEEFAVKAFKFSAIDYLLKPVDPDDLVNAIAKVAELYDLSNFQIKLNTFLSNLKSSSKEDKRIVLRTAEALHVVNIQDIMHCESEKSYTQFFLSDGRKPIVSKTLKEFDDLLSPFGFFRSHQSHLINLNYLESYEKRDGGAAILKDKSVIPVSVRKKEELISILESL